MITKKIKPPIFYHDYGIIKSATYRVHTLVLSIYSRAKTIQLKPIIRSEGLTLMKPILVITSTKSNFN